MKPNPYPYGTLLGDWFITGQIRDGTHRARCVCGKVQWLKESALRNHAAPRCGCKDPKPKAKFTLTMELPFRNTVQSIAQWAEMAPVSATTICARLNAGWPIRKAIFSPPGTRKDGKQMSERQLALYR